MSKIKLIWICIKIFIVVSLITTIAALSLKNKRLEEDVVRTTTNFKALQGDNDSIKNKTLMYQLTIDELNYYNDSIIKKLTAVTKELRIKDKELKQLQYVQSNIQHSDTIITTDTIFVESAKVDTIIGDEWYKLQLIAQYPNIINTQVQFTSEKYIVAAIRKETVNPPKKCWLARLFQKKHKILEVEVVEKNPYIEIKKQKFIEILKK